MEKAAECLRVFELAACEEYGAVMQVLREHPDWTVRLCAVRALAHAVEKRQVLRALLEASERDPHPMVRYFAEVAVPIQRVMDSVES